VLSVVSPNGECKGDKFFLKNIKLEHIINYGYPKEDIRIEDALEIRAMGCKSSIYQWFIQEWDKNNPNNTWEMNPLVCYFND